MSVCPCNIYGGFFNPDRVWYLFKKLLKEASLPDVRFHDLRHDAATVLLAAKVDLKVVSELLGHSSVAIYTHTSIPGYFVTGVSGICSAAGGLING